jgi:adenine-specific DNA-methyltransferase
MSKKDEALEILRALGLPRGQQNERSALTLLALAGLGPKGSWANTQKPLLRTVDIMEFMRTKYRKDYAANSRETIRRQTIHQFEQARLVDRNPDAPSRPTNSGNNFYCLTDAAIAVLKSYGTDQFEIAVEEFVRNFGQLEKAYAKRRDLQKVKLELPSGATIRLSPGKHNALQVAVVEEFGPRFAPGAKLLYLGDTAKKHVVCASDGLAKLRIGITEHDKLPDIVLHDAPKNWLFLIEAVTTHGPVSPKRHAELEIMLAECPAERVYVTAFLDKAAFRKYAADIAWETEVWIAETPDHMVHFNGPKFLGPRRLEDDPRFLDRIAAARGICRPEVE